MQDIKKHFIHQNAPILQAIEKINNLPTTQTLFVINDQEQMLSTLTDGDIRRGFINGCSLEDKVLSFIPKSFYYLNNEIDVKKIKSLKEQGIRLLPKLDKNKKIIKVYDLQRLNAVLPLDAVIMAGGRGERLRPLTDTIPKPMVKIGDKPIIKHTIDRLISYGIENIYVSVNYLKEQIIEYLSDISNNDINIHFIEEKEPLGTAGALSLCKNLQNDILLMNSDLFTNINYEDFYMSFKENNADMSIASIPYTINIPYAILQTDNNLISSLKEKPTITYYANGGIYLLNKNLIELVPYNTYFNATDLIEKAIKNKMKITHNLIIGYWIDIGRYEDLEKAQQIVTHL